MPKQWAICAMLLDTPCVAMACPGHRNESVGEVWAYCVANARDAVQALRHLALSLVASVDEGELDGEIAYRSTAVCGTGPLALPLQAHPCGLTPHRGRPCPVVPSGGGLRMCRGRGMAGVVLRLCMPPRQRFLSQDVSRVKMGVYQHREASRRRRHFCSNGRETVRTCAASQLVWTPDT
jgi:hypothetical protein